MHLPMEKQAFGSLLGNFILGAANSMGKRWGAGWQGRVQRQWDKASCCGHQESVLEAALLAAARLRKEKLWRIGGPRGSAPA